MNFPKEWMLLKTFSGMKGWNKNNLFHLLSYKGLHWEVHKFSNISWQYILTEVLFDFFTQFAWIEKAILSKKKSVGTENLLKISSAQQSPVILWTRISSNKLKYITNIWYCVIPNTIPNYQYQVGRVIALQVLLLHKHHPVGFGLSTIGPKRPGGGRHV